MRFKQIHFFSGLFISCFVALHLLNHLLALGGAGLHLLWMDRLRLVYRHWVVEPILLGAVLVQIISGLRLFWTSRKTAQTFFERLQRWSGAYLAFFLLIHLSAVLGGRWVLGVDTNVYFGAAGLNLFPLMLFFVPYYSLAMLAFFGHLAAIHARKMTQTLLGISPKQQAISILVFGACISFLILAGLTGYFQGLEIPTG